MRTYPKWFRTIKLVALYGVGGCFGLFMILVIVALITSDNEKAVKPAVSVTLIKALIEAGANPNARDEAGGPTLLHSVAQEYGSVIKALIEAGAKPAVSVALIKALIEVGADPNARVDENGFTPLHEAALHNSNPSVIKALIEGGADPGACNKEGFPPLHLAAGFNSNPAVTTALIEGGADPNAAGAAGTSRDTPLHTAATNNSNPAVIVALIEGGADPGARNKYGDTPFKYAKDQKALKGTDAYRLLSESPAVSVSAPESPAGCVAEPRAKLPDNMDATEYLFDAVRARFNVSEVKAALSSGADLGGHDFYGNNTSLHYAALYSDNPAVITALIEGGADPGARDDNGKIPFDYVEGNNALKALFGPAMMGLDAYRMLKEGR